MKRRKVLLAPRAEVDLDSIGAWIAERGAPLTALAFIGRIRARIAGLSELSERGVDHGHVRPGLRTMSMENGVIIAYAVREAYVEVERVFSPWQNWRATLRLDDQEN